MPRDTGSSRNQSWKLYAILQSNWGSTSLYLTRACARRIGQRLLQRMFTLYMPGQIEPRIHGMKFGDSFCVLTLCALDFHRHLPGFMQGRPCHGVSFFEACQFRFEMLAVFAVLQGKSLRFRKSGSYQEIFQ